MAILAGRLVFLVSYLLAGDGALWRDGAAGGKRHAQCYLRGFSQLNVKTHKVSFLRFFARSWFFPNVVETHDGENSNFLHDRGSPQTLWKPTMAKIAIF